VIVPARNEAATLPDLLGSLVRQTRPPDQVLVVDDHSSDDTARVARDFVGVEVFSAPDLPASWTGKCWACATGARRADGDLLLFLDADVTLADDAIASLLTEYQSGLLSVQPHHRTRRWFEALSMPFNIVAVMGLGIGSVLRPRRRWGAAGPCLLCTRASYEQVGGHTAVRSAVAEDLALGERYRQAGEPLRVLGGGRTVAFRMYRTFGELVQGWSKNFATGARRTPFVRALMVGLWVTAASAGASAVVDALVAGELRLGPGLIYAAGCLQFGLLGRMVGRFGPAALLWPLLVAFFVTVFAVSVVQTVVLRRVRWKGRTLRLGDAATVPVDP
jgi:4,4'-diaponeurosporenoate glycosyltransferase